MSRRPLIAPLLCLALGGCAATSTSAPPSTDPPSQTAASSSTSAASTPHKRKPRAPRARRPHRPAPRPVGGLVYSTASADQVQPQPGAGSCRATGSGVYSKPDPACTPGALNPAVTQATIHQTICVPGYTKTIRPAESVTEQEKRDSMAAYGDGGSMSDYEYDHLVSLELGGAANDPRNLWPEPGASPNPKDAVENRLHDMVCSGEMPLAVAQHIIATGWVSYAQSHGASSTSGRAPAPHPAPAATPPSSPGPNKPVSEVNCSDFATHADAQRWFVAHGGSSTNDVAGLDGNHNGIACEDLP